MSLQNYLTEQLQVVCPIMGVSFGDLDDKSTWFIQFDPSATPEQQSAANDVLNAFVWDDATQEIDRKQIRDASYANDLSMKSAYSFYKISNPNATFSDFLDYAESIQT